MFNQTKYIVGGNSLKEKRQYTLTKRYGNMILKILEQETTVKTG